ncbi:MAG TPA: hypothetical protein VFR08_15745, partial [Candidatus Angelobacter sp.]|nr:hypothetical protein [Candidatus Angelobacter sp.]
MMRKITIGLCALALTGTFAAVAAHEATAQGGTAPQSQSMGASRSGSAIDSKSNTPTTKSEFDKGFTGQESELVNRERVSTMAPV